MSAEVWFCGRGEGRKGRGKDDGIYRIGLKGSRDVGSDAEPQLMSDRSHGAFIH